MNEAMEPKTTLKLKQRTCMDRSNSSTTRDEEDIDLKLWHSLGTESLKHCLCPIHSLLARHYGVARRQGEVTLHASDLRSCRQEEYISKARRVSTRDPAWCCFEVFSSKHHQAMLVCRPGDTPKTKKQIDGMEQHWLLVSYTTCNGQCQGWRVSRWHIHPRYTASRRTTFRPL